MRNIWLVGVREFRQRVRSRGFLIGSIATPIILIVIWYFTGSVTGPAQPGTQAQIPENQIEARLEDIVGYVDQAGLIQRIDRPLDRSRWRAYTSVDAADQALASGEIEAYYLIPVDYLETGDVRRVSPQLPASVPENASIDLLLAQNLVSDASADQVERLLYPLNADSPVFVRLGLDGEEGAVGNNMLPFVVVMVIMLPLFTSGGYLLQSLTQEKSNRVMEILLASLRPRQLLTGKLLGLGALIFVQYLIWVAIAGLFVLVTGTPVGELLAGVNFSLNEALLALPYALGGFTLYAAVTAGIGALASNLEESRSWIFMITLPMMIPIYLWMAIVNAPNGGLAVTLSLVPFSAPIAMLMRMTSSVVPTWQILVSLALLFGTAVGIILLMARLFRVRTLLSGEALSIDKLTKALQQG